MNDAFEKELNSLKADVQFFSEQMKEVVTDVINEGFSQYPVFVAHQHEVKIGEVLFDKEEYQRTWTFNASVLEELMEKKVIHEHKREAFEKAYKDPQKQACVFWVTTDGASFVFVPYAKNK
jgi:hypothetical protein